MKNRDFPFRTLVFLRGVDYTGFMNELSYSFVRSRKAKTLIPGHTHPKYEFVYFFGGKGTLEYDGKAVPFSRGSYYIMENGMLHSELYENTGISLVVQFTPPFDELKIASLVSHDTVLHIGDICEHMREELKNRKFGYEIVVDGLMREIVTLIARNRYSKCNLSDNGLTDAILYIDQYFMTTIKIDDLAYECGYSPDHFRILFKQKTRTTPKAYILQKRLTLAKKLLKDNKLSIAEIAVRCGFASYAQFMTFFKSRTGYSPDHYRKL